MASMFAERGVSRRASQAVLAAVLLAVSTVGARAQVPREPTPDDLRKAKQLREDMRRMISLGRDRVFPALVNIEVVTVHYWGGKERKGRATGSGTIISAEGHVLTNQHVTSNGKKFKCTLADKQEISAKLVGEDPLTDLAVLKLNLSELRDPSAPLSVARFGDSSELEIGDYVMAMGSPFSLSRSVTLGIVSNTERVLTGGLRGDDRDMELQSGQRTGLFTRWIQHDALINPGNSGGPLVNLKGEVVGINELGGSAIGFAIPSNLARGVADALIKYGEVPRSRIGVSFKPIEKTGLEKGVLVNSVEKDGPAYRAGIRAGDVIVKIDGDPVTIRFREEVPPLMKRFADMTIGSKTTITYERDGATAEATITTTKLHKDRGDEAAFRAWGLSAMEITEKMARDRRLDSTAGVLVSSIRSGGPAQLAEPPLDYSDVIRTIDGEPVADLAAFVARYRKIMDADDIPEFLLISFDRRGRQHVTLLKPKPEDEDDPPGELRKAWIGMATQPVLKRLAEKLGHPDTNGFRITRVYPETQAAESDLRVGDVIVELNEEAVVPRGMQDAGLLARAIRKLRIDESATLTVLRDGQRRKIQVLLERTRITRAEARRDENRDFELTVRELTFFDRDENRWDRDVRGVLVESAESGGWAGLGGIIIGDLIQRIDQHEIRGLKSYRETMKAVTEAEPKRVVFVVLRGVQTRFQYVEPEWNPVSDDAAKDDKK